MISNSIGKFGRSRATWAKLKNEFDPQFYSSQIGESLSLEDGLSHYLNIGWTRELDPSRQFSTAGYLSKYVDVADSGQNPLVHYVRHGSDEGRTRVPSSFRESQIQRLFGRTAQVIAFVTTELHVIGGSGGIGAAVEEQARCAVEAGFKVAIFYLGNDLSFADPRLEDARRQFEIESVALELISLEKHHFGAPPVYKSYEVYKALLEYESQLTTVVFSEYEGLGFHVSQARVQGAHFENTDVWVVLHGSTVWALHRDGVLVNNENQLIQDYLERSLVETADKVISPSKYLADNYFNNGWISRDVKVEYIKNPTMGERREQVNKIECTSPDLRNIVFIGRGRSKGLVTFCRSLSQMSGELAKSGFCVTFLGLGGGTESLHALKTVENQSINWDFNWNIYPMCNRASVRQLLRHLSDPIVVVASQYENCPYAVLDALIDGYRVISSELGGGPELYSPKNKGEFLFKANDHGSLSEKIQRATVNSAVRPGLAPEVEHANQDWRKLFLSLNTDERKAPTILVDSLPFVTIGITHFDRLSLLCDAVKSALMQDYKGRFEVVVVDDGTPDSEEKLIVFTSLRLLGVRIIEQENAYLGAARNTILREADGDFVLFLDDDDILIPTAVSWMVRSMLRSDASVVTAMLVEMRPEDRLFAVMSPERFVTRASLKWIQIGGPVSLISRQNLLGTATAMFRRAELIELGGYSELYGIGFEDFELLVKYRLNKKKVVVYPDPIFAYQTGVPSMLSTTRVAYNYSRVLSHLDSKNLSSEFRDLIELDAGITALQIDRERDRVLEEGAGSEIKFVVSNDHKTITENHRNFEAVLKRLNLTRASSAVGRGGNLWLESGTAADIEEVSNDSNLTSSLISLKLLSFSRSQLERIADEVLHSREKFSEQNLANFLSIDWPRIIGYEEFSIVLERFIAGYREMPSSGNMDIVGPSILAFKFGDNESLAEGLLKMIQLEDKRYLDGYPGLSDGIPKYYSTGFEHFVRHGKKEGRNGFALSLRILNFVFNGRQEQIDSCFYRCERISRLFLEAQFANLSQVDFDERFREATLDLQKLWSTMRLPQASWSQELPS